MSRFGYPLLMVTSAPFQPVPWFPLFDHSVVYVVPPSSDPWSNAVPMVAPYMLYWKLTEFTSRSKSQYMLNLTPGLLGLLVSA